MSISDPDPNSLEAIMRDLPEDTQQKLRTLALKQGTTVSAIVKTALLDVAARVTTAKTTTLIAAGV